MFSFYFCSVIIISNHNMKKERYIRRLFMA